MPIWSRLWKFIDWFIPADIKLNRSERGLAQNFVFTHLFGPALSQSISVFLYLNDPNPGVVCWTIIVCIWMFWALPFVYRATADLQLSALISVELLAFTSLFGAFFYGGVSSPFLPWMIISLLLGFFYLSERPVPVIALFTFNIAGFVCAYLIWGFPDLLTPTQLAEVGWISILSATIYMSWMAIYYANMISMRSDLEREAERHRETSVRLLEAKELADRANRARSIFLAKMSHELRTPLNAVIGFSEILLEDLEFDGKGSSKKADLQRINSAGKYLLSLVTEVLDLSKIESNRIDLKIEQFDLNEMIRDVVNTVQPLVAEKDNRLVVKCSPKLGVVSTDQVKLRQAMLNLLSNAAKFTEAGTITLSAQRRKYQAGDWIEIQVNDTGIGIAEADAARLFQNFGQADQSTASKYGGTGLGLAISQKLCAMMGGGISAVSALGQGSSFTIRVLAWMDKQQIETPKLHQFRFYKALIDPALSVVSQTTVVFEMSPLNAVSSRTLESTAAEEVETSTVVALAPRPRLLVVDDIKDNRDILVRRFERRGFDVTEADSGGAAIDLIKAQSFDLVLLDVMMPGIDGLDTLKWIRSQKFACTLPVIMVTAKAESSNIVDALELGANDYVTKPVDFAIALARVNAQISRRRAEQQVAMASEQLRKANEDLERRVEERTKRLLDANEQLKLEIASREELQAKSQYLAFHDPLTGLGNRLLFREQLEESLRDVSVTPHPLAVLFLDLDGFKSVNDTVGHSVGDLLLKSIGAKLREMLPPTCRIARLGGDEFAILQMSSTQPAASVKLAEKVIEIAASPMNIDGHDVHVGASVGIAIAHPGEMDSEKFLKSADLAMYGAKSEGRGTYRIFDPQMDEIIQTRRSLEQDLRMALSEGQFTLNYQPLVNLQTGKVTAFEALMRWTHPDRGAVAPTDFIPVAENMGLIVQVGEWALRQACMDAVNWPGDIRVSVNLSPRQFAKGNLVSTVVSALASSQLPRRGLSSKSPRRFCSRNPSATLVFSISCANWVSVFQSTISVQDIPASAICAVFRSTRSRSISPSFAICSSIRGASRSCARSRGWARASAWSRRPKASRPKSRCASSIWKAAPKFRIFYSRPVPANEVAKLLVSLQNRQLKVVPPRP